MVTALVPVPVVVAWKHCCLDAAAVVVAAVAVGNATVVIGVTGDVTGEAEIVKSVSSTGSNFAKLDMLPRAF